MSDPPQQQSEIAVPVEMTEFTIDLECSRLLQEHLDSFAYLIPEIPTLQDQDLPSYRQCWDEVMPIVMYAAAVLGMEHIVSALPERFVRTTHRAYEDSNARPEDESMPRTCQKRHVDLLRESLELYADMVATQPAPSERNVQRARRRRRLMLPVMLYSARVTLHHSIGDAVDKQVSDRIRDYMQ